MEDALVVAGIFSLFIFTLMGFRMALGIGSKKTQAVSGKLWTWVMYGAIAFLAGVFLFAWVKMTIEQFSDTAPLCLPDTECRTDDWPAP